MTKKIGNNSGVILQANLFFLQAPLRGSWQVKFKDKNNNFLQKLSILGLSPKIALTNAKGFTDFQFETFSFCFLK